MTSLFHIHVKEMEFQAARTLSKEIVRSAKGSGKTQEAMAKFTEAKVT